MHFGNETIAHGEKERAKARPYPTACIRSAGSGDPAYNFVPEAPDNMPFQFAFTAGNDY
jgi:hypothetical protein